MKIKYVKNKNNTLGPGIEINLNGVEIATAINNYLVSRKIESGDTEEITVDHESGPFGILDYFNQDGEI